MRQLAGDLALGAHRAHRLQHRRRPAGVDGGAAGVVALEQHREQVGDVAAVAGVAVLAGEADLASRRRGRRGRRSGLGRGSRAGPGPGCRARRSWRRQIASGATPMPPPTRIAPGRARARARAGAENGVAERAGDPDPLARLERRRAASVPGPTASTRKSSRTPPSAGARHRRPRRRAAGRAARRPAPSRAPRRACRTGPRAAPGPRGRAARRSGSRPRRGSASTSQRRRPKGRALARRASGLACGHVCEARARAALVELLEGADLGARLALRRRSPATAAEAPVIVVTQGMPWRTAAVRIS